jgi:KUP system potassium uptake protein
MLALGIVYGDLGTSPLYTLQAVVGLTGGALTPDAALGSHSLIFWSLIATISIKYSCSSCAPTTTARAASWR